MSFIFWIALGFVWAYTLITVTAQNPVSGFKVPWVIDQADEQGRPAKGRLNISNYLKERRL